MSRGPAGVASHRRRVLESSSHVVWRILCGDPSEHGAHDLEFGLGRRALVANRLKQRPQLRSRDAYGPQEDPTVALPADRCFAVLVGVGPEVEEPTEQICHALGWLSS